MSHSYGRRRSHRYPSHHGRRSNPHSSAANSESFYDGSCSYGIEGSWINGPDHPAPSFALLRQLQDKGAAPQSSPSCMELGEAFGLAHEALGNDKITAVPCLGKASWQEVYYAKLDLPFMVFDDLDRKLFRSMLRGNVYLTWASLPTGSHARTSRPNLNGRPRITIELNWQLRRNRAATLGVLLHQMIHAYYLQCCGHKNKGVIGRGHDLRHKEEFYNLSCSIREHFLPGESLVWDAAKNNFPRHTWISSRYYVPEAGCSNCYCKSITMKKRDLDQWRDSALALTIAKIARDAASQHSSSAKTEDMTTCRSQYVLSWLASQGGTSTADISNRSNTYCMERHGSSVKHLVHSDCHLSPGTYITLWYDGRRYPVLKQGLRERAAISRSPFFSNDTLVFPSTSSLEGLEILVSFLESGGFAPSHSSALTASKYGCPGHHHISSPTLRGPPIMLQPEPSSPKYLGSSILAYRLATTLQFEPLKSAAIKRLYGLPHTYEDPIALLGQVYMLEPALPQEDHLRAWVRDWLTRTTSFVAPYEALYPTNLHFLQRYPGLEPRFDRLLQSEPNLARDVSYAAEAIIAKLKIPPNAPGQQYDWQRESSPSLSDRDSFNHWHYQHPSGGHVEDHYRKQQEQEAAQRQYALDAERRAAPPPPVDRGNTGPSHQHYDANIEALRRYR